MYKVETKVAACEKLPLQMKSQKERLSLISYEWLQHTLRLGGLQN